MACASAAWRCTPTEQVQQGASEEWRRQMACSKATARDFFQLWIMNADGMRQHPLTSDPANK